MEILIWTVHLWPTGITLFMYLGKFPLLFSYGIIYMAKKKKKKDIA